MLEVVGALRKARGFGWPLVEGCACVLLFWVCARAWETLCKRKRHQSPVSGDEPEL